MTQLDELGRLRRRRAREQWMARWSVSFRVTYPPGRLWRLVAAIVADGIVCGPGLAISGLAAAIGLPWWGQLLATVPLLVSPFLWSFVLRGEVREDSGDRPGAA